MVSTEPITRICFRSLSKWKAARVPRPTVGGGEARTLGCVPVLSTGTPYSSLEPTLSASQNPRTHFGVRRGVVRKPKSFVITKISDFRTTPGLCRAHVRGRTPTDTPPWQQQTTSVAVALPVCSGVTGSTQVSPETSAGGIKFATGRFAGSTPETTAKPRATVPVVLHTAIPVP